MSIQISYIDTINTDKKLAVICFDNEKSLNAQSTPMVKAISLALEAWRHDDSIAAIVMRGAGQKAYCAGGDIRSLYQAINQKISYKSMTYKNLADDKISVPLDVADFFDVEYRLMYRLHTYHKPIISWGDGIVMGGGMGLFAGSSHKIVTDKTVMAMPEAAIGLFPDAGGSYFLNRMMGKVGLFLGLTGAKWTAADAHLLGLADCMMAHDEYDKLIDTLSGLDFGDVSGDGLINRALSRLNRPNLYSDSPILANLHEINRLMNAGTLWQVDKALRGYQGDDCQSGDCQYNRAWLQTALATYRLGCPTTHALTWQIYHTVATWSLKDILKLEYNVAKACCYYGDFAEGVRALLIDKDKSPKWQYTLDTLPFGYIDSHFGVLTPHPFDDL